MFQQQRPPKEVICLLHPRGVAASSLCCSDIITQGVETLVLCTWPRGTCEALGFSEWQQRPWPTHPVTPCIGGSLLKEKLQVPASEPQLLRSALP